MAPSPPDPRLCTTGERLLGEPASHPCSATESASPSQPLPVSPGVPHPISDMHTAHPRLSPPVSPTPSQAFTLPQVPPAHPCTGHSSALHSSYVVLWGSAPLPASGEPSCAFCRGLWGAPRAWTPCPARVGHRSSRISRQLWQVQRE